MNIGKTQWGVGGAGKANTHTHTHTHSVPGHTGDGWSLGQGSNTVLTYVGVAPHKLNINGL